MSSLSDETWWLFFYIQMQKMNKIKINTYRENIYLFLELSDMIRILIGEELQLKCEMFKFNLLDTQVILHCLQVALQALHLCGRSLLVISTFFFFF